jgi:uncharacterized membrane protein YphA (DoxX/SURF4 family)
MAPPPEGKMMRVWRAWSDLWARREPATAQALVRIFVGIVVLADLLDARRLGLVEAVWAPPPEGMGHGAADRLWSIDWFGKSADTAWLLWWLGVGSSLALIAGLGTRVAAIVFVLISAQLAAIAPDADRGIDTAMRVVILILAFSWCHARWSVDAWIRRRVFRRPFTDDVPAWPRYLLLAQLIWIYFSGGHNKSQPEWYPQGGFAALANALSDPHFARFSSEWVPMVFPIPQIAAAVTIMFEWGAPLVLVCLYYEATAERGGRLRRIINRLHFRHVWILVGVGFHFGIALLMQLGIFPWGMLACYPVLLRSGELQRAEAWLTRRLRRTAPPDPSASASASPEHPAP